jgi:nucleotidyltransferase substrate binding protein (TIGR01987 family)
MQEQNSQDVRWLRRFSNFKKALSQMRRFIQKSELNELEMQGLIQCFEYTHELAWKTLKDFLEHRGSTELFGSKDVTREAFKLDLITDGDSWMTMIQDFSNSLWVNVRYCTGRERKAAFEMALILI